MSDTTSLHSGDSQNAPPSVNTTTQTTQMPQIPRMFLSRDTRPQQDHSYGPAIPQPKPPNTFRIILQNMNGIPAAQIHTKLPTFLQSALSLQTDIALIQEHNLDVNQLSIRQKIATAARSVQSWPIINTNLSTSTTPSISTYKPGGTGIMILTDIKRRMEPNLRCHDPMGRWTRLTFRRPGNRLLTVISCYQVCPRPTNQTGNTAFHQQTLLLKESNRSENPRKAFINDLLAEIRHLQNQGHELIIGGDWNETIHDHNSGLLSVQSYATLSDPWIQSYPFAPDFGTHQMGNRRIDTFLVSSTLLSGVKTTGYLPFQTLVDSDHRAAYLDFSFDFIFGNPLNTLPPPSQRSVHSRDLQSAYSFIQVCHNHLHANHLFDHDFTSSRITMESIETIDRILGEAIELGKSKTKKRRSEWYSPALAKQRIKVAAIRNAQKAFRSLIDSRPAIQARLQSHSIELQLPEDRQQLQTLLNQELKILKQFRLNSKEIRHIALKSPPDGKSRHRLITSEQDKATFQIVRNFRQSREIHSTIDQLYVPLSWPPPFATVDPDTVMIDPRDVATDLSNWRHVTDPDELQYYLTIRNRSHFGQAQGTPFTVPPLSELLDWTASSDFASDVLQGISSNLDIRPTTKSLLQFCQQRCDSDPESSVSMPEFKGKIVTWNEYTSTSPSGRHLGCYKTLFVDLSKIAQPSPSDPDDTPPAVLIQSKQSQIAHLILNIINWCIRNQYVLQRWRRIQNTMIFKEPGNYFIHRLRIIHIFEADYNLLLAVKWRRALRRAEQLSLLHDGQFGGRSGRDAQSLPFLEELRYEIAILARRHHISFDNDAMSCYDRIIPALAALINKSYGQNPFITNLHARALLLAEYFLSIGATSTDDSAVYSNNPAFPIYGTGQGSGNSPCIWTFISSTLFAAHASSSDGSQFRSHDGSLSVSSTMVGFVDDATCTCADFRPQENTPFTDLTIRAQAEAQLWSDLLFSSGGRLELQKCSFHPMEMLFHPDGTPYINPKPTATISIRDPITQQSIELNTKAPSESRKTLGHHKAPYDRQKRQSTEVLGKAKTLSRLLAAAPINRFGARKVYHAIFVASTSFPLPQSYLTPTQLSAIDRACLNPLLAKMGYLRTTARNLIFSPKALGGAGIIPASVLQGEGQVSNFLRYWRTDNMISLHLRIAMSWAQFIACTPQPLLEDPSWPLPYVDIRWIMSLRTFLSSINATIQVDTPFVPPTEFPTNFTVMQMAAFLTPTLKHLRIVQWCRLYLNHYYITDLLCMETGRLRPGILRCERPNDWNKDTIVAVQKRPSSYQLRNVWRPFLRTFVDSRGYLYPVWNFGLLFTPRPPDTPPLARPPMPLWTNHLTCNRMFLVPRSELERCLTPASAPLLLVSDGSVSESMTYGWLLGTITGQHLASGQGHGFGNATSYRAEAYAMLSGALFLTELQSRHGFDLSPKCITFASDNSALVNALSERRTYSTVYPNSTLDPEWDVREQLWQTIAALSIQQYDFRWVKGHQDSQPPPRRRLSVIAKFNILADRLAASVSSPPPESPPPFPAARCTLYLAQEAISSRYIHRIRRQAGLGRHRQYCLQRFHWSDEQYDSVDWKLLQRLCSSSAENEVQRLKFIYDLLPTNAHRHKLSSHLSSACSHCQAIETFDHILRCTHPCSLEHRLQLRRRIMEASRKANHSFDIQLALDSFWADYLSASEPEPNETLPALNLAIQSQSQIGWKWLLRGISSKQWMSVFPPSRHSRDPPFVQTMLRICWEVSFSLWKAHLSARHASPLPSSPSPTYHQDLVTAIKHLYDQRHLVRTEDVDTLFPADLDEYLRTARPHDLAQYISLYQPAIKQSIRAARSATIRTTRPLTSFGFQTTRTLGSASNSAAGDIHRRHTRWRPSLPTITRFYTFFNSRPD